MKTLLILSWFADNDTMLGIISVSQLSFLSFTCVLLSLVCCVMDNASHLQQCLSSCLLRKTTDHKVQGQGEGWAEQGQGQGQSQSQQGQGRG